MSHPLPGDTASLRAHRRRGKWLQIAWGGLDVGMGAEPGPLVSRTPASAGAGSPSWGPAHHPPWWGGAASLGTPPAQGPVPGTGGGTEAAALGG